MKIIITLTDKPDGSVGIEFMQQMTTEEALADLSPQQSRAYQTATMFSDVVANAKALAHEMRLMHAEAIEKAEFGSCLH